MSAPRATTACLILIGNELLSGRTQDANLSYLGKRLAEIGVRLAEARVIPDIEAVVVDTVNDMRARHDYVFTTGGIGPTHDDITTACIAKAFGVGLFLDPEAVAELRKNYQTDDEMTPARLKMCTVPEGATLIDNPVSRAPGFKIGNVYVMAGIPRVFQGMFETFADTLEGGPPVLSRSIVAKVPEGRFGVALSEIQDRFPDTDIGSYPFKTETATGANLVVRGTDLARVEAAMDAVKAMVRGFGVEPEEDA